GVRLRGVQPRAAVRAGAVTEEAARSPRLGHVEDRGEVGDLEDLIHRGAQADEGEVAAGGPQAPVQGDELAQARRAQAGHIPQVPLRAAGSPASPPGSAGNPRRLVPARCPVRPRGPHPGPRLRPPPPQTAACGAPATASPAVPPPARAAPLPPRPRPEPPALS